jgi:hypothetical protein
MANRSGLRKELGKGEATVGTSRGASSPAPSTKQPAVRKKKVGKKVGKNKTQKCIVKHVLPSEMPLQAPTSGGPFFTMAASAATQSLPSAGEPKSTMPTLISQIINPRDQTTTQAWDVTQGVIPYNGEGGAPTAVTPDAATSAGPAGRHGVRTATVAGALTTLNRKTTRFLLKQQTKENLFKNNKFVDEEDLRFSNNPHCVFRQLVGIVRVPSQEVENWWYDQKKDVLVDFHNHRNNVIKAVNKAFKGKCGFASATTGD